MSDVRAAARLFVQVAAVMTGVLGGAVGAVVVAGIL